MTDTATEQPPAPKKPGNRGKKCSREEADERTDFVARLVSKNLYRSEIQKAFETKFGEMSNRQVEEYIARARKLLKKHCNITREEARELTLVNLLDILRSGKGNERNRALELWVKVHGLEAPVRMEHSGPNGGSIRVEAQPRYDLSRLTVEQLAALHQALQVAVVSEPEPKQLPEAIDV